MVQAEKKNNRLRMEIANADLSQREVARVMYVHPSSLSLMLKRDLSADEEKIIRYAIGKAKSKKAFEMSGGRVIRYRRVREVDAIEQIEVGDWIDLRTAEAAAMKQGEYREIPLGVAMELPKGYEAIVAPRSSTFRRYGILMANGIGIIDESYKGDHDEWRFPAIAMRDTVIPKNARICQFRIFEHQPEIRFREVDSLGNADRGGLGSTGWE